MPKLTTIKFESDFGTASFSVEVSPEGVCFTSNNHLDEVDVILNKKSVLELVEFLTSNINEIID